MKRGPRENILPNLCLLVLLLLSPVPAGAQTLDEVVNGVEATYGKIVDLRAEFAQTARNKSLGQDIKAEGIVLLKKGGKMRWDYKSPARHKFSPTAPRPWSTPPSRTRRTKATPPKSLPGPPATFPSVPGNFAT